VFVIIVLSKFVLDRSTSVKSLFARFALGPIKYPFLKVHFESRLIGVPLTFPLIIKDNNALLKLGGF
jgi:hypothetical protein